LIFRWSQVQILAGPPTSEAGGLVKAHSALFPQTNRFLLILQDSELPDLFVSFRRTREVPFLRRVQQKLIIFGAREYEGEALLRSLKNQDQW